MTKRILKDIPEADVDQVVKDFESEGCTVSKEKQPNGKWTVTADCPDKRTPVMPGDEMPEPGDEVSEPGDEVSEPGAEMPEPKTEMPE